MSHLHAFNQKNAKGKTSRYRCTDATCDPDTFASDSKKVDEASIREKQAKLAAIKAAQEVPERKPYKSM